MRNVLRGEATASPLIFYILNVLIRIIALFELSRFPNFSCPSPALDTDFFYFIAELIRLKSPMIAEEPFYYSPLFAYYMAFITSIFGDNPYWPRIITILIGSTIPIGIFFIARDCLNSRRLAYIALFVASFYDLFIFYDNQVLKTTFGIFFITWGLYFLIRSVIARSDQIYMSLRGEAEAISATHKEKKTIPSTPPFSKGGKGGFSGKSLPLISGLFFGLACLVYANILLFLISITGYFLIKKQLKSSLLFIMPIILIVGSMTLRNYIASKDFVLITAVDGIHFYIGNNKESKGIYNNVHGIRPNPFGHYFDTKKIASNELKKDLKSSEVSRYYKAKAIEYIKENPLWYAKLLMKKLLITINRYDVPNDENIHFIKDRTFFMKYCTIPFWIIGALGITGLILSLKDKRMTILTIFTVTYAISVIMFFVADRYRLPLAIPLMIYSANFFSFATKDFKRKALAAVLFIGIFFVVNIDIDLHQMSFYRGAEAKMRASEHVCRIKDEIKKTDDNRKLGMLFSQLGGIYLRTGGWEEARYYFKKAFTLDPSNENAEMTYYKLAIMGIRGATSDE